MGKLTVFIIGMVVFMVFFTGGIATLMSSFNKEYHPNDFNQSDLDFYNKLDEISTQAEEIKNSSLEMRSESGITDVLGGFFEASYNTIKIAAKSFGLFGDISNRAIDDANLPNAEIIKTGIMVIVIILIFLGIIVASVIKVNS